MPEYVDHNFWLGPVPERPFNRARLHGSWRHFWYYGGGIFSDWSLHLLDMALWPDDILEGPDKVMAHAEEILQANSGCGRHLTP